MERFQPREYLAELRALAEAAGVSYDDLLLLQYIGDVKRCIRGPGSSSLCTSFAILPPLTRENACIVGRNFDYYDNGVGDYASVIAHYRPAGKTGFVTITWAGIINGWTLLSEKGIVVSNNTTFDARSHSLEGMSTCFLMRHVVENAATVDEAVELIRKTPRSCSTAMLVAGGNPPIDLVVLLMGVLAAPGIELEIQQFQPPAVAHRQRAVIPGPGVIGGHLEPAHVAQVGPAPVQLPEDVLALQAGVRAITTCCSWLSSSTSSQ